MPKHLAVLRAGDGAIDALEAIAGFIDEFAPGSFNAAPLMTLAIPTNGPDAMFFNGHAATEGMLCRSSDDRFLTFAGYGGSEPVTGKWDAFVCSTSAAPFAPWMRRQYAHHYL